MTLYFGGVIAFLVFLAMSADGYFEPDLRYVYEFFTLNSTDQKLKNQTSFDTVLEPFNATFGNFTINGTLMFYNLTNVIPKGSLSNSSILFFVQPGVPGLAIVVLALFFIGQLTHTIIGLVRSCTMRESVTKIIFFSHGQGIVLLLGQYTFYALIAFCPDVDLTTKLSVILVMAVVFGMKCLFPLFHRCRNEQTVLSEIEMLYLMPHGFVAFFSLVQVPVVMAHVHAGDFGHWDVWLTPTWMTLIINTTGWTIFTGFLVRIREHPIEVAAMAAVCAVYLLFNCAVAASLILFCINDNADYFGKSEWPFPWVIVVLPVVAAYAVLCLGVVLELLLAIGRRLQSQGRRCCQFLNRQNREASEHYRRADNSELPVPNQATAGRPESQRQQIQASFELTLLARIPPHANRQQWLLKLLTVLQDAVRKAPEVLATSSNRSFIIRVFKQHRAEASTVYWTERHAKQYSQLLRHFTSAKMILLRMPSLDRIRGLSTTRVPPPPTDPP